MNPCSRIVGGVAIAMCLGTAPFPHAARIDWARVISESPDEQVIRDPTIREQIKATGLPWLVRDRVSDIPMVLVPPGTFMMGSSDSPLGSPDQPAHAVTISKPFYIGVTEVTQEQWVRMMRVNPSHFQRATFQARAAEDREAKIKAMMEGGFTRQEATAKMGSAAIEIEGTRDWPVESISREDLSKYLQKTGLCLPSEAQWEYACRAGVTAGRYGELDAVAWCGANSEDRTHAVASKVANQFGLHDTLGNVWEWCADWYASDYYASCAGSLTDPTGPATGEMHVLRGGNWMSLPATCSAPYRIGASVGRKAYGFRVARYP